LSSPAEGSAKATPARLHVTRVPVDGTYRLTERTVLGYEAVVIKSFADRRTAAIFVGYAVRNLPQQIQRRARAKLLAIDAASMLHDLRAPPSNRLEALHGDRKDQFSIRINDQWRICFVWRDNQAWDVEIVDYH
jgi:toxin HigB-1